MSDCIIWTGAVQSSGYGSVTNGRGKSMLAHRKAWETANGAIPAGLTIDHLCRNKLCQNVDHMEVVTASENVRRAIAAQTHCKRGHELAGENVLLHKRSTGNVHRVCRECNRIHAANSRARRGFMRPTDAREATGLTFSELRRLAANGVIRVETSAHRQNYYYADEIERLADELREFASILGKPISQFYGEVAA